MRTPRKRKRPYSAVKIVSPTGKLRLLSAIKRTERNKKLYKDPDASFWADWKPYRKLGVFANERTASYTQNGITKYM